MATWFDKLSTKAQLAYLKKHPNSKHGTKNLSKSSSRQKGESHKGHLSRMAKLVFYGERVASPKPRRGRKSG